jgi:hypothetical protein
MRSSADLRLIYSQSYHGVPQQCTGKDQLLLARGPWEDEPILICGVSLTHRVYPPTPEAFAMAGSSAVDGDILCHVSGSTTANIFYPEGSGFLFPGRPASSHIDVHAWCAEGEKHEVWLTIFYYKPVEGAPEPFPIPNVDNDKLDEIARLHPVYRPVPPAPPPPTMRERVSALLPSPIRRPISEVMRYMRPPPGGTR